MGVALRNRGVEIGGAPRLISRRTNLCLSVQGPGLLDIQRNEVVQRGCAAALDANECTQDPSGSALPKLPKHFFFCLLLLFQDCQGGKPRQDSKNRFKIPLTAHLGISVGASLLPALYSNLGPAAPPGKSEAGPKLSDELGIKTHLLHLSSLLACIPSPPCLSG